jgi:hypothetical protein
MSNLEPLRLLKRLIELQEHTLMVLERIEYRLTPHLVTGFKSRQENPMVPLYPGNTIVITFTPLPVGAEPASGDVPTITSSDPVNAPVTADSTGLVATVAFPETAVVGTEFGITINYTNPDGTVATPNTFSGTIVAPPPPPSPDVTGFTSEQTT